ncbi:MAG: hypothetical protein QW478_01850 [Candidatus Micrarchaeaceae archaeon]
MFNYLGFQIQNDIYFFSTKLQSKNKGYNLVLRLNKKEFIYLYKFPSFSVEVLKLTFVPVGYKLLYEKNDVYYPLPYETNTPFSINDGNLVLCKLEKRIFGFTNKRILTTKVWPVENLQI